MNGVSPRPSVPIPTRPAERLAELDVLRGFAIGGILLANIHIMSGARAWGWRQNAAPLDLFVDRISNVLIDGSFFPLFSFLFGLGLAVQMLRAEARGVRFVPLYLRRLTFLLLIAVAHWMLVWDAFILINYSVLGAVLLLFRHRSPRTLLVCATLCLACQILVTPLSRATDRALSAQPAIASLMQRQSTDRSVNWQGRADRRNQRLTDGAYRDVVLERAERFELVFSRPQQFYPWRYGSIFAMFLLGLYAGRRRIFNDLDAHLGLVWKVMWFGLAVGLAGNVIALLAGPSAQGKWIYLTYGASRIGSPAMSFFYASAIVLLLRQRVWRQRSTAFAAVGRMALTNYLLQSVIATSIFYGYGLGLYGAVGITGGLMLAAGIFMLQLPLSVWWLSRFRYGPVEWLWRSLTYGSAQPFLLRPDHPIPLAAVPPKI